MKRRLNKRTEALPRTEPQNGRPESAGRTVSRVLATGLVLSVVLLLTGAIMVLAGRGPSPPAKTSLADLPRALAALEPGGFLNLGLVVLLATPVARVVALVVSFARRRAWLFCGISCFVLALLALSAYLGLRG
jgi:uncharacterized membrane protein